MNASDDNSDASNFSGAEPLAELLSNVLDLAGRAVDARYTSEELQRRRARIERAAEQDLPLHDLSPATAASEVRERRLATAANSPSPADIDGHDAGMSNGQTRRLTVSRLSTQRSRPARRRPNESQGGLYVTRAAPTVARQPGDPGRWTPAEPPAKRLLELAQEGKLADTAATAQGQERRELTGAAYEVVWPIVYARVTRRFEQLRGHAACAAGVSSLANECLDRFHDDVEAVVDDLLAHARQPIPNLEAWITARLTAATVDGHRRRRGQRGALQRPRLPRWITDGLGHDPWLSALATQILVWVGAGSTAGTGPWPLEAWAQERGRHTGDWASSDPSVLAGEVETVLAVMRRKPAWYESFIERPLGTKQAPVADAPVSEDGNETIGEVTQTAALPAAHDDSELQRLAAAAVEVMKARIAAGEQAEPVVVDVIRAFFGGSFAATLDQAPHAVADPPDAVEGALTDVGTVERIVATVMAIIGERRQG